LTWTEGLNNGGKVVEVYEISYAVDSGTFSVLEAAWPQASGTSYTTAANLVEQGKTYTFKIRSRNSVGYSL
jgi:predicted NUDIX family NTP pyrophosphohydrolase